MSDPKFGSDAGVLDLTEGRVLVRVDSNPTGNQYAVDASGTYSFAPELNGHTLDVRWHPAEPLFTVRQVFKQRADAQLCWPRRQRAGDE